MAGEASMLKFLKPKSRLQPVDVQAAAFWGVAAVSGALYLIQVFSISFVHFVLPLILDLLYLCSSFAPPLFWRFLRSYWLKIITLCLWSYLLLLSRLKKNWFFLFWFEFCLGFILFFWKLLVICLGFLYMLAYEWWYTCKAFFFFLLLNND